MFKYLYWVFALIVYILALPLMLIKMRKPRYKERIPATFFLKNNPPLPEDKIWFHANSLGEVNGLSAIAEKFNPDDMVITTVTNTGYKQASQMASICRYLPYELFLPFWTRKQKILLVTEAEFKYMLFAMAKIKGTPRVIMINARVNEKRYERYKKFAWYYRRIFTFVDKVYAQRDIDKERLIEFGAKNVEVIGNIKLANLSKTTLKPIKPSALLVCAASTHDGEEILILDAFSKLKKENREAKILLVPRHPERFPKVKKIVEKFASSYNYTWHQYSKERHLKSDIIIVDLLGELANLYAVSDIVIMGGTFEPIGGHNVAEAAQYECKIISGKHYFSQMDIYDAIEGIIVVDSTTLASALKGHKSLPKSKILRRTDIAPIVHYIKKIYIKERI